MKDVFICHASEDKEQVVFPLVAELKNYGLTYWLDKAEINWGDSLIDKINEGLSNSKFVVVVLSENFLAKRWPQRELNSILNIEASTGEIKVLPLVVGNVNNIAKEFILLNDKLYIQWKNDPSEIAQALSKRLSLSNKNSLEPNKTPDKLNIPLPKIKRNISQREKDLFLKKAYADIYKYFEEGLLRLEAHHEGIETDLTQVHNFKFLSKIYLDGALKSECKIWLGGSLSNGISYAEGRSLDMNNDNSFNDWLSVEDNSSEIFLKPSGMSHFNRYEKEEFSSGTEGAEYLWRRFISSLEHI